MHNEIWLIDHGASLFFHHSWVNWEKHALSPFIQIKDHALLSKANRLDEVDAQFKQLLSADKIQKIVQLIPDDWLHWADLDQEPQQIRAVYSQFLTDRMECSEIFINEAKHARKAPL